MSDPTDVIVQRVVQIQVPPEQELAAHAAEIAVQPPAPEHLTVCDALFAGTVPPVLAHGQTSTPTNPTAEEQQAAAAMVLMYAQQLLLSHDKCKHHHAEPPQRPRQDDDPDDA